MFVFQLEIRKGHFLPQFATQRQIKVLNQWCRWCLCQQIKIVFMLAEVLSIELTFLIVTVIKVRMSRQDLHDPSLGRRLVGFHSAPKAAARPQIWQQRSTAGPFPGSEIYVWYDIFNSLMQNETKVFAPVFVLFLGLFVLDEGYYYGVGCPDFNWCLMFDGISYSIWFYQNTS